MGTIRNRVRYCRQKNSRQVQDYELSDGLVKLGVSTIFQLSQREVDRSVADVTQIVQLDVTQGPAKRRRLSNDEEIQEVGLELLCKELQSPHDGGYEESKIPWLQLLADIIVKYPEFVVGHEERLVKMMSSFIQVSKSSTVRRRALTACQGLLDLAIDSREWKLIGRNTVTLLSNNQLGVEGHKFLRILLT